MKIFAVEEKKALIENSYFVEVKILSLAASSFQGAVMQRHDLDIRIYVLTGKEKILLI